MSVRHILCISKNIGALFYRRFAGARRKNAPIGAIGANDGQAEGRKLALAHFLRTALYPGGGNFRPRVEENRPFEPRERGTSLGNSLLRTV
jgi:hypothetical protein